MKKKQPPGKSPRAASKAQLPLRPTGAAPSDAEPASGEPASPRQHLKLPEVLAELEAAAKALEVRLTYEAIGGELGAGGLCKVKGQWRVIIDKRTTPSERVSVLAQALSRFDFPRLRRICESEGVAVHGPISQNYFLTRLGARERAQYLSKANSARADEIRNAVQKLVSPTEMGERFKAVALTPHGGTAPPGF